MLRITVARRNYLLYLLLPHPMKMALLDPASRQALDRINVVANEAAYSGTAARDYDLIHRYGKEEQHEQPAKSLVTEVWAPDGYGDALEIGAGTGYFTSIIAPRAKSVVAVEPGHDLRRVLRARCEREGLSNVEVFGGSVFDLDSRFLKGSIDSAIMIQTLHHLHRRDEVFRIVGRLMRRGGRLFLLEPHHNLRRVLRLAGKYASTYRSREFWTEARNWATHDFLTRAEIRSLCRRAGFGNVSISTFWLPGTRRFVQDPSRRLRLEGMLGRVPGVRHFGGVLGVRARRVDAG